MWFHDVPPLSSSKPCTTHPTLRCRPDSDGTSQTVAVHHSSGHFLGVTVCKPYTFLSGNPTVTSYVSTRSRSTSSSRRHLPRQKATVGQGPTRLCSSPYDSSSSICIHRLAVTAPRIVTTAIATTLHLFANSTSIRALIASYSSSLRLHGLSATTTHIVDYHRKTNYNSSPLHQGCISSPSSLRLHGLSTTTTHIVDYHRNTNYNSSPLHQGCISSPYDHQLQLLASSP